MRVTVFDYGAGNLHSLVKALDGSEMEVCIEADAIRAVDTDVLVLPGVGAFGAATQAFGNGRSHMQQAILSGLPTLGICLGMQLLFDRSDEGDGAGLGVIPGTVRKLTGRTVPQIGWNTIEPAVGTLAIAYYANSYVCRPDDESCVQAWSTHDDDRFPAVVRLGSAVGVQFHPEKSSSAGVVFIQNFLGRAERRS